MRAIRLVSAAVIVAITVLTVPMSSSAATARGSIMIHARLCPVGALQLFRDCHETPDPPV